MAASDPPKRGRPHKNPPPLAHLLLPDPDAPRVGGFATGDMVWGKKLNHTAWPGLASPTTPPQRPAPRLLLRRQGLRLVPRRRPQALRALRRRG
jgi:hypothetical protein